MLGRLPYIERLRTLADPLLGVLVLFLPFHPSHYLPSVLRDLMVDRKQLDKMEGNGRAGNRGQQPEGPIQATVYWV